MLIKILWLIQTKIHIKLKYKIINSIYKKSKGYQFKVDDGKIVSFDKYGNML